MEDPGRSADSEPGLAEVQLLVTGPWWSWKTASPGMCLS